MVLAICDPQGAIILRFKKLFQRDEVLSKTVSTVYEFWTIQELLDACQKISFDCVILPNEISDVYFPVAKRFFGGREKLLIEAGFSYTLFAGNIVYCEIDKQPKLNSFIRIHKSYFVNALHIKKLSNYKVILDNGLCLNSSRGYFKHAKEKFDLLKDTLLGEHTGH